MLGTLPYSVTLGDIEYKLNTDYHICLIIMEAMEDEDLSDYEKANIILKLLYKDCDSIPVEYISDAYAAAVDFLNGHQEYKESGSGKPVFSWIQDANLIFPELNKIAGKELRDENVRMHWFTFLGYFSSIPECMFTNIVSIREKLNSGKKLEKYEKELLKKYKHLIVLKPRMTHEEKVEYDILNNAMKSFNKKNGGGK